LGNPSWNQIHLERSMELGQGSKLSCE
jgi:hypothetical protein